MRGMEDRERPPHLKHEQAILNHHWPSRPRDYALHEPGIAVRVRLIWERDGEQFIEGVARRWDADHVYVELKDTRSQANGVWLKPQDVYRRSPD
ncbi:hypothetical protein G1H11_10970 [Phytoactinopolyspora alkaliphila]|uniref:Uncharacterized protein n=1 Tax=Phytoactinopolyspora alkaliphila TaxID=1783498 RepID=A0A6N9YLJ7_9ACTN|nr:hypothetical protein [Phytoactinopolyspora alkaliphila]NED95835.1 hypothetical protein [Phytoactinopolyspora alkaliphila]